MSVFRKIEPDIQQQLTEDTLKFSKEVSGGIVNEAALFVSQQTSQTYFVKYNAGEMAKKMFDTEQQSLQLLARTGCVTVPASYKVFTCTESPGAVHVLEYIEGLKPMADHWALFGQQIGRLHNYNKVLLQKAKAGAQSVHQEGDTVQQLEAVEKFGSTWEHYLGTFTPGKGWRDSWQEMFIGEILQPLVSGVVEKYRDKDLQEKWSWLQRHLHKVFDQMSITPSITHGDLCIANFGQTERGPVLFDPSVQYAHSQFDLILSHAEEKFDHKFFEEYHHLVPKEPLWDECMLVYELFYNMVMLYHLDDEKYKAGAHAKADKVMQMLQSQFGAV